MLQNGSWLVRRLLPVTSGGLPARAAARGSWTTSCGQPQAMRAFSSAPPNPHKKKPGMSDTALYLVAVAVGMLGLSYASVPLYRMFCQATGYAGTAQIGQSVEDKLRMRAENPDAERERRAAQREVRVWFSSDVAEGMPWRFTPAQQYVRVRPGESTLVFYTATNLSDKPITGVSTYNVVPDKMGYYFNKIQCFCFEEQRLRAGETVDMPVFFYLDPEMVDDWNCRNVHDITLSYTFFRVDDEAAAPAPDDQPTVVRTHGPGNARAPPRLPAPTPAPPAVA